MKIAYLIQYFGPPENSFASARSYDFAIEWAKKGNSVWVICSDAYLLDKSKPILFSDLPIKVSVIKQNYKNEFSIFNRILAFLGFAWQALMLLLSNPTQYDVLYASSTPLTVGLVGFIQNVFTKKKWIFELRDLWPDFPLQMLNKQKSLGGKFLYWLEKVLYKNANHLICLSPEAHQKLITEKKVPLSKLSLIPNGFSASNKPVQPKIESMYLYEGALGKANHINWVLTFFDSVLELNKSATVFISGFGLHTSFVQNWAKNHQNADRIHFLGTLSRLKLSDYLAKTMFSVISFSNQAILKTNSPNKLFDVIPYGIIPITNTKGWISELAIQAGGFYEEDPILAAKKSLGLKKLAFSSSDEIYSQFNRSKLALEALTLIYNCG